MNVICEQKERTLRIRVHGDINRFELASLKRALSAASEMEEVVLDLSEVDFAGSDFINLLLEARHVDPDHFNRILVLNPTELVEELIDLSGLRPILRVVKTEIFAAPAT